MESVSVDALSLLCIYKHVCVFRLLYLRNSKKSSNFVADLLLYKISFQNLLKTIIQKV